jgi:hypothetical protein
MLAAEWHLIDESYGWLALGFSAVRTSQTAQIADELCQFRHNPSDRREPLTCGPVAHE